MEIATIEKDGEHGLLFWCPGCEMTHRIQSGAPSGANWIWNGDFERPTVLPSVLVSFDHRQPPAVPGTPAPENKVLVKDVCHSFINSGRIQFLADCTHSLANQTVDLPVFAERF